MSDLALRMERISQSDETVTIPKDGVPLFEWDNSVIPMAVNFLRCGVTAIQIVCNISMDPCTRSMNPEILFDFREEVKERFNRVALRNEKFVFHWNDENWTVLINLRIENEPQD